jgi:hypothetical protein
MDPALKVQPTIDDRLNTLRAEFVSAGHKAIIEKGPGYRMTPEELIQSELFSFRFLELYLSKYPTLEKIQELLDKPYVTKNDHGYEGFVVEDRFLEIFYEIQQNKDDPCFWERVAHEEAEIPSRAQLYRAVEELTPEKCKSGLLKEIREAFDKRLLLDIIKITQAVQPSKPLITPTITPAPSSS